ncbi:chloramphenicol phosphotransferase CPT [Streptomyces sp. TRM66268-LWL]|uniref:Chloramphenicol phosphotransferase CPT n=1 Tax=Streptomyces polyasparticus TaxID=2767826 RepID=A0ABR7SP51_9ACTN|nr:chloramphenicol phosphotransferase CPT [Streptomyces polyasparticus]MBC9716352.1 chloramphenicol phosphotransferase CPT [Streptomyces polyasparticus]
MATQVIILNGGSSSGKSGIVRCLQSVLPDQWLAFGCDSFVDALPARMQGADGGIEFADDGSVHVGGEFRALQAAWTEGVVAMARAGARIIIDDVFLGAAASQESWREALGDVPTLWVGVRCDRTVAAGREIARGDRTPGMAALQAETVHEGVRYDVEVDTTHTESLACAKRIAAHVG